MLNKETAGITLRATMLQLVFRTFLIAVLYLKLSCGLLPDRGWRQLPTTAALADWRISTSAANLPRDLEKIRACRIQAFVDSSGKEPEKMLSSQKQFVGSAGAKSGRSTCLVAKERVPPFRILGTADIQSRTDGAMLMQNVFVAPDARGSGLGRRLVKAAELWAAERSDTMILTVDTSNRPAMKLYQSCDYKANGIHSLTAKIAKATGFDLQVEMKKDLSL